MATYWEIAAPSVNHMFSFYRIQFDVLVIFHFGFNDWLCQFLVIAYFLFLNPYVAIRLPILSFR